MPENDRVLRNQLLKFLDGGNAHITLDAALRDFPGELRAMKPEGAPHSAWQLLEHTRLALHDLLEFCTNSNYLAPKWPEDYWPATDGPPSANAWNDAINGIKGDMQAFKDLINDPAGNLYAEIPWGEGQTVMREVLLAGQHTSYHLGQIVFLKKQLEAAPKG